MPPLAVQPTAERFRFVLQRFYGFHSVWESSLDQYDAFASLLEGRGRLPHLERNLAALGISSDDLYGLPRCLPAAELTADPERALGSLYVMEGSTLGGQIISRAIAGAEWAPPGGLSYFNPYGQRTGLMWRALQTSLDASPDAHHDRIINGALRTFAVLQDWMESAPPSFVSGGRSVDQRRALVSGR